MKGNFSALLPLLVLAAPLTGFAAEQLIPAGSLVQCTVSEPKLSSKTTDIGDPVLCQVSHVELYGRSVFPYGSYLVGRFEEYKDPGHFVGKGWMELKFERMVIPPDQVIPVAAKVVYVPKFQVDKQGRIHGNGHPVRDIVEWSIPVLWPIDLLNLPRRGPRPELKAETRLTLKIMDDLGVPLRQAAYTPQPYTQQQPYNPPNSYGFSQRAPMSYTPPPAAPPPMPQITYNYVPPPPPPPQMTVLMLRDGNGRLANEYWFEGGVQVRYIGPNGYPVVIPIESLDLPATVEANRRRGVAFTIRAASY
jgi:hypothetical protein